MGLFSRLKSKVRARTDGSSANSAGKNLFRSEALAAAAAADCSHVPLKVHSESCTVSLRTHFAWCASMLLQKGDDSPADVPAAAATPIAPPPFSMSATDRKSAYKPASAALLSGGYAPASAALLAAGGVGGGSASGVGGTAASAPAGPARDSAPSSARAAPKPSFVLEWERELAAKQAEALAKDEAAPATPAQPSAADGPPPQQPASPAGSERSTGMVNSSSAEEQGSGEGKQREQGAGLGPAGSDEDEEVDSPSAAMLRRPSPAGSVSSDAGSVAASHAEFAAAAAAAGQGDGQVSARRQIRQELGPAVEGADCIGGNGRPRLHEHRAFTAATLLNRRHALLAILVSRFEGARWAGATHP